MPNRQEQHLSSAETPSPRRKFALLAASLVMLAFFACLFQRQAGSSYATAEVLAVAPAAPVSDHEAAGMLADVTVRLLSGARAGRTYTAPILIDPNSAYSMKVEAGDKMLVVVETGKQEGQVGIDEHYRAPTLALVLVLVASVIILIGRWQGLVALLALALTVILVFGVLTRLLVAGHAPVLLAIVFSAVITSLTLTLIGGLTKKTAIATLGTVGGVTCAGLFGYGAVEVMHLSGFTGHEAVFLQSLALPLDFRGLLLCGVIIGALGAVMDVCMSLATSLEELARHNPALQVRQLFDSGMKMGSDLLGTMTNTLVLAYTGSSLTLILLLTAQRSDFPIERILNMEFITVEIVRSIAGLFGMAVAIPISAALGGLLLAPRKRRPRRVTTDT